MNLLQELENQFRTKTRTGSIEEKEKIAVDFLTKVNFQDVDLQSQAIQYIKHMLTDYVEKNEEITSLEAKIIHCLITKITLSNLGLNDTSINYRNRTANDRNAGAYYQTGDKSLNFFNEDVCNIHYFLKPYTNNQVKGAESRLNYFIRLIFVLEHEIQHVLQFKAIANQNGKDLTPSTYIMTQQSIARDFAMAKGTKYYKETEYIDRLYEDNHDQFYYEIDADKFGIERTLDLLRKISPLGYQIATDERQNNYVKNLTIKTNELENYGEDITWQHDTNPDNKQVLATHKASMIIGSILPKLSAKQRKEYFETYPSLAIVYNADGSRKTLDQVEKEKQEKINLLLINGTDREVQENATKISLLYDTAIEGDAVLSFEKCLQHISRLSWHSDRYFTNNGIEVKYNPSEIRREMAEATKKAKLIAGYIEDADAVKIKAIFARYKKERNDKINNLLSQRFYEDKIRALGEIEQEFYHNKEAKQTIRRDKEESKQQKDKKKMEKYKSLEIIQTLFPKFDPNPYTYIVNDDQVLNNVKELLMLMEAYKQYVRTITKDLENIKNQGNFISSSELYRAIKNLYDFEPTPEQLAQFQRDLKEGKIKVVNNKYMPMAEQLNTLQANYGVTTPPKIEPQVARQQSKIQRVSRENDYTTDQR